jgi:predicted metalloprotease with PDZ domain
MKTKKNVLVVIALLVTVLTGLKAQNSYRYKVDINSAPGDELKIELLTPKIITKEIVFHLPKIVPGTYVNSDFGKFVHDLKAFDKSGKELVTVLLPDSNSWKISDARKLYKIEYQVEDTWDTKKKHNVYEMAGTNFEEGKNFVLNTFALFGYFDGMKKNPFEIEILKPGNLYASTPLVPIKANATSDLFRCNNVDLLYDSPIMYCVPDTTTVRIGNTDVLISLYSPKKLVTSKYIAENIRGLLEAAKTYLGGSLPVKRYAFLYYFNSEQPTVQGQGALEHSYSSFYSMIEAPEKKIAQNVVGISSHEFFHIVTPLNICSKEVREFNFNQTVLSKHLWLYEGSTEYDAHHAQVTQGLITLDEYLDVLQRKINSSRAGSFNDSLPLTEMSLQSAGKYADQFLNIYFKGALVSACLDILLNKLSNGKSGLRKLKHDLYLKYGPVKYFKDAELFDEIAKLTYPEIRLFFSKYVEGNTPIPYEDFFKLVGMKYSPKKETMAFTTGGFRFFSDGSTKPIVISNVSNLNVVGNKMGYKKGDEIVSINGRPVNSTSFTQVTKDVYSEIKEGDLLSMIVKRKNEKGETETITLSTPAQKVLKVDLHVLELENVTGPQLALRNAWLKK